MAHSEGRIPRPQFFDWIAAATVPALFIVDLFVEGGNHVVLSALGIVSFALAIVFIVPPFLLLKKYGRVEEGKSFMHTTAVVDRGVYGIVRHPQYLGYMFLVLGFMLLSQHGITLALGSASIIFFYLQALREEPFCAEHLAGGYDKYSNEVPRINFIRGFFRYIARKKRST